MSINELAITLEDAARSALGEAGALEACRRHPAVTIRRHDEAAERRAYAIATNRLKAKGEMFLREELMDAIKEELDMAADGACPACGD